MAKLTWDALGERKYEIGVDRGVLYHYEGGIFTNGVAWNGLTGVDDDSSGRESSPLYSGDRKVGAEYSGDEYSGKIKCYTYPDEFDEYLGEAELAPGIYARQQSRNLFGFCYRSRIGNDAQGIDYGYKLHLIYNMQVTDFSRSYSTVNDSSDVNETEISFDSFPQEIDDEDFVSASEIVIDSREIGDENMANLEAILYGNEDDEARLPFPDEIIELVTEKQVMPDEWYLYPNTLIQPARALYPQQKGG